MKQRLYLDHAATTPLLPEAKEAMVSWLDCGNASSLHADGRRAKDAVDEARERLSATLGCLFAEVLFTSGGTEAANLAIVGAALANTNPLRRRILLGAAEHHCVLHTSTILRALGYEVSLIPVDREARVLAAELQGMLDDHVFLVSVMHANNELGSINDVALLAQMVHSAGAVFHVDAVQTFTALSWKVADLDADLITVSSHKINGPKGVGAIYIAAGTSIKPLVGGGGQEREVRGGTENVAAIVGFGVAAEKWCDQPHHSLARDRFLELLHPELIKTVTSDGPMLSGHAHVRLPGVDAEMMLIRLDREGVSASSGAACSSGSVEPSHVMMACGYSEREAREGVRFTFGRGQASVDGERAAEIVNRVVEGFLASRRG